MLRRPEEGDADKFRSISSKALMKSFLAPQSTGALMLRGCRSFYIRSYTKVSKHRVRSEIEIQTPTSTPLTTWGGQGFPALFASNQMIFNLSKEDLED
jgi:hypothetical protein